MKLRGRAIGSLVIAAAAIAALADFRQAMAYLMNEQAVIEGPLKGYAYPTVGPVASQPLTSWLSPQPRSGTQFAYNPAKANSLLTSHGWSVAPGGTTCVNPSLCGQGITKGSALSFTFAYESGVAWVQSELTHLQSNAAALGIRLNLKPEPFTQVVAAYAGNCVVAKLPCNWDMADWGLGWSFYPDVLPTGETLFMCGAIANSGGYCDRTNDTLIDQTLSSGGNSAVYAWQNYLSPQLPVEWQPNAPYQVTSNLKGVLPQTPTLMLDPEDWSYVQ